MRISELVEELNQIRAMKGDLLVSVFQRENNFDNDGEYYINVELDVVNNTNTKLKNGQSEIIIVNEPYFLAIG
ncbi:hypothetical protein [Helicobacter pullorum]|uniref:hypothetical protein n=1 Tax=Helicobacter pullorum TaxID=35818 RepID=UPI000816811E|nr:hypothetical protein [Helicobacter pullorum]EAL0720658.1 hypothetical protein [Campylobacter jejuni]OCR07376.1 hypothetical protein A7X13_08745 [Helicobacter pullorum]